MTKGHGPGVRRTEGLKKDERLAARAASCRANAGEAARQRAIRSQACRRLALGPVAAAVLIVVVAISPRALALSQLDAWTNVSSTAPINTAGTVTITNQTVSTAGAQRLLVVVDARRPVRCAQREDQGSVVR